MNNVKESIIVAFAFVGVVVGAGFATGQEIFQFFTSHGIYSIGGIFITGLILTLGGIFVLNTGFRLKSQNHSESIRYYLHPTIAKLFDIILTVFLFSLAIIMTAGGASTINESFGLPFWLSSFSDTYFDNIISKVRSSYRCFRRGNTISCGSRSNDCSVLLYYR